MPNRWTGTGTLLAGLLLCAAVPAPAPAQSLEGTGLVATGLMLREMDGVKRVLMIAAHPDDEDTTLLAWLARKLGAETAYLSLTRGEGGQNLIGPELWDGLGVIRTGELEAARRLDGGRQYFTRAFDFGFSKRADETLELWHQEELLGDVVWVIRKFRPHVILSVFTGSPTDGHGHHQGAGLVAREAFDAAGDPLRFPEQMELGAEAWAPLKLYTGTWRRPDAATVRLEAGGLDPLLGRSPFQLAMESRSLHRSQDMGSAQPMGPRTIGVRLEEDRTGADPEGTGGLFAGVDTTLAGIADRLPLAQAPRVRGHLEAFRAALARARASFGGDDLHAVATPLHEALGHLLQARAAAGAEPPTEVRHVLDSRVELAGRALLAAGGVVLDVRGGDDLVTPGQTVRVTAHVWNGGPLTLDAASVSLELPHPWASTPVSAQGVTPDGSVAPGTLATWSWDVTLPEGADLSRLYYLRSPRNEAWYTWPEDPRLWGLPRDPSPVSGRFSFRVRAGTEGPNGVEAHVPWSFVGVNPARGEYRRPVLVVPAVAVSVTPGGMVWPAGLPGDRTLTVSLRGEAGGGSRGTVRLRAPAGWEVHPGELPFETPGEGEERSFAFRIRPVPGAAAGEHLFHAEAVTEDGVRHTEGFSLVDYEHVERTALFAPAQARVTVVPVQLRDGLRVGYIMGTGDEGPEAIRQLGAEVTLLSPDVVRAGAFDRYHVVVVGVRAYETRDDLRSANGQLLDFARRGGTVLVQYNQFEFPRGGFAPYPVEMSRPARRVTEEGAEVTVLHPDAPVFTTPNRINPDDFEGWVQERGLYFLSEWDPRYTPLLEMADQGEEPARGSLLVAGVGEGVYAYVALALFRQWSAGVPGAYRLWANLLSLDGKSWRAFEEGLR